jgi:predicted Fe-Mo cluster-binding NifX family protein
MKVAVASQGQSVASAVDPRFGRAKFLIVIDTATREYSTHQNTQNLNADEGLGIQAARNAVSLGADVVVAGNIGPKALAALQAGNVTTHIGAAGSVSEAVGQLKAGRLECVSKPNVEEHWV